MKKLKLITLTLLILTSLIMCEYVNALIEYFKIYIYDDNAQPINDNFDMEIFHYVYQNGQQDVAKNQYLDFLNIIKQVYQSNAGVSGIANVSDLNTIAYNFTVIKQIGLESMYYHTTDITFTYIAPDTSQSYVFDVYYLIKPLCGIDKCGYYNQLFDNSTQAYIYQNEYYIIVKHKQYNPSIFSSVTEDVFYPFTNILKVDTASAEDVTNLFNSTNENPPYFQIDLDDETNKIQTYYLNRGVSWGLAKYFCPGTTVYVFATPDDDPPTSRLIGYTTGNYVEIANPVVWHSYENTLLNKYIEIYDPDYLITTTPVKLNNKIYFAVAYIKRGSDYVLTIKKYIFDAVSRSIVEGDSYDIKISDKIYYAIPFRMIFLAGVVRPIHNDVVFYDWFSKIFIYFNFNNKLGIVLTNVEQNDFTQFKHSDTLLTTEDDTLNIMFGIDNIKDDMFIIVESYDSSSGTHKYTKYRVKFSDWFEELKVAGAYKIQSQESLVRGDINPLNPYGVWSGINYFFAHITNPPTETDLNTLSSVDENGYYYYELIDLDENNWFNLVAQVNWPKTAYDITVYDRNGADITNSVNLRVNSLDCTITQDTTILNRFIISEDDYGETCQVTINVENKEGALIYQKQTTWKANGQLNTEIIDMSSTVNSNTVDNGVSQENQEEQGDGYYFIIYDDRLQQVCDEKSYIFKTDDGRILNFKVTDDCEIFIDWGQIDKDGDGLPDFDKIMIYKDGKLVREIDTTSLMKNKDTIIFAYNSDEKFVLLINLFFNVDQALLQLDYNDIRDDLLNNIDVSIKLEGNMVLQGVKQDNAIINLLKQTDEYNCRVIFDRTSATFTTRFITYACLIDRKVLLDGQNYNVYVSAQTKIAKLFFGTIDLGVQMQQFTYQESMQYERLDTFNYNIALTEDLQSQIEKKMMFKNFLLNTQFWAMLIIIVIIVIVKYLTLSDKIAIMSASLVFLVMVALKIISSAYLILISLIAIVIAALKLSDKLTSGGSD